MSSWRGRLSAPEGNALQPRTLAEVYGMDRLLVEQHRGIIGYSTASIRIAATYGTLIVEGEALRLCCMSRSQLVIRGYVRSVKMVGDC